MSTALPTPTTREATREEVYQIVIKYTLEIMEDLKPSDIKETSSPQELGLNSLDIVEIVFCVMQELKIQVPRAEFSNLQTLGNLIDLLFKCTHNDTEPQ